MSRVGQLAPWGYRVGATLLDALIVGLAGGVLAASNVSELGVFLVGVVVGLAYTVILIGLRGQTVGMMALGTRCVDATTGTLIGYPRAAGRWLVGELLGITIIGGVLDDLWPLWDPRKQTLHDKALNTVVVFAR